MRWSRSTAATATTSSDLSTFADYNSVIHLAGVLGTAELFDTAEDAVTNNVGRCACCKRVSSTTWATSG